METMVLEMGKDALTRFELLQRAATHRGLKLQDGSSTACSEPIKEYTLDERLLKVLTKNNIRQQGRPDCGNEILTLVDMNPQEKIAGWAPSNYWNFKFVNGRKGKFDLRVNLLVGFRINLKQRGIVLNPLACGTFLSPCDHLPNFRMFKVLTDNDSKAPPITKELVSGNGMVVITWTELGLGGIRPISDLFSEFVGGNEAVMRLNRTTDIFNPIPNPPNQQPRDEVFVVEKVQPLVFKVWREQLESYGRQLALP